MAETKRYPAYRAARMRWLPPVPEHWNEQRAKTFFHEVDERSKTGHEELLSVSHITGVTPRSQKNVTMFKAASYVGSKLCRPGDIVINTLWAWMAALGTSKHAGIVSPAYGVYRPHSADSFNPVYLDYLLRTCVYVAEYIGRSTGIQSSRLRLYPNQFLDIPLLQPPRAEQDQVVAYLRAKDAHIARFIKAKRDLIALLTEQKLRLIDHAVTHGIDASVKLKPSGIEWMGEVPQHWSVVRLKWVCRFTYGDSLSDANRRQGNVPVFGSNGPVGMHDTSNSMGPCIVIGRKGSFGKVNYSESDLFAIDTTYFVDRRCTKANIRWLYYLLVWCRLDRISKDSAVPGLDRTDALNTLVPLPDGAEQERIAKQLDIETAEVNGAIAKVEDEIKLIREYRDRLIADVVTGQVDVRGWQPGSDDIVNDEELAAFGDEQEELADEEDDDGED
ncbi:restriction endonuclease subunit S [Klebsiella pneumoniae]|nr:restriction endonuclease subunit S [Klebsiella pneumoniae]MBE9326681.1 restriction endonuclease subunit S [Klebsiella pneumoniae]PXG32627.1 restriction endonuclease subunit S [Klebsiella pneumoniae]PXG44835.1 restriction endonuclease subunit S [Klebsiella pneumoniae]